MFATFVTKMVNTAATHSSTLQQSTVWGHGTGAVMKRCAHTLTHVHTHTFNLNDEDVLL